MFINETLVGYCEENEIEFTRSRAYRKNDQAWVEQKNGSVIRRFVGHERHSGAVAGQTMAHLYGAVLREPGQRQAECGSRGVLDSQHRRQFLGILTAQRLH